MSLPYEQWPEDPLIRDCLRAILIAAEYEDVADGAFELIDNFYGLIKREKEVEALRAENTALRNELATLKKDRTAASAATIFAPVEFSKVGK